MTAENRREFLERLGVASVAMLEGGRLAGAHTSERLLSAETAEDWDMSWVKKVEAARYRAVIDANVLEDGYAADLAAGLLDHSHETQRTRDDDVRVVIVARRGGTPLVMGDALWERYPLGEDTKLNDRRTNSPYRRNPFYRAAAGASEGASATKLDTLMKRGVLTLVCNIAINNWARGLAEKTGKKHEEVVTDVKANLVPGTIVMPSGVFALMRAQNAGCAFMRGQ